MTALVVSSKRDAHCTWVTDQFDMAGHPWLRVNTEDFATNVSLSVQPSDGTGTLTIRDSGRALNLEAVTSVWYRKPDPVELTHFELDRAGLDYIEGEFTEVIQGLYALLKDARWVNNPLTTRLAHRKLLQLKLATKLGLQTPRTIVSNIRDDVIQFARSLSGDLAVKSLGALSVTSAMPDAVLQYGLFTRRITSSDLDLIGANISHMPTVYQEYVEKAYELRVTVVGQKFISCKIDSQSTEFGKDDFRIDTHSAEHSLYSLPSEIESKLLAYMTAMDINFGCFDLIKSTNGAYYFIECNPNGQWLWIEKLIRGGIPQAIAKLLMDSH